MAALLLSVVAALSLHAPVCAEMLAFSGTTSSESQFIAENEAAMATMMSAMAITPTGDVDRDFVAMMVPHHQAAVDMAIAQLRHGRNERLRRMAQEIIVTQRAEIVAMQQAIGAADDRRLPSEAMAVPHHDTTQDGRAK